MAPSSAEAPKNMVCNGHKQSRVLRAIGSSPSACAKVGVMGETPEASAQDALEGRGRAGPPASAGPTGALAGVARAGSESPNARSTARSVDRPKLGSVRSCST